MVVQAPPRHEPAPGPHRALGEQPRAGAPPVRGVRDAIVRHEREVPVCGGDLELTLERGMEVHSRGRVRRVRGEREGAVCGLLGEGEVDGAVPRGRGYGVGAAGAGGGGGAQRDFGLDGAVDVGLLL